MRLRHQLCGFSPSSQVIIQPKGPIVTLGSPGVRWAGVCGLGSGFKPTEGIELTDDLDRISSLAVP